MTRNTLTWHGGAGVEIDVNGRRLMVDPYCIPDSVRAPNYVCVSHDDHDHFDETTIARFAGDEEFQRLLVPPSCVEVNKLDSPVVGLYRGLDFLPESKLTVMHPKYTREPGDTYGGPGEIDLEEFRIETIDSSERPERYRLRPDEEPLWPEARGAYTGHARYPNLGYHITAKSTGMTFYHPGDLHEQFNAHYELAGKIDVLFFPLTKFVGQEKSFVRLLRPKYIVPMHYRVFDDDFPIPYTVPEGTDPYPPTWQEFQQVNQLLMSSHWYPSPADALEELELLRPVFAELGSELVVLKAGHPFDLDALA
jgi:L-ascorbate metabolism protein UlaG (beta-lactamase superfamily)